MKKNNFFHAGFTLIEVAIVLAIVGTLLAGGLMAFSNQSDRQREKEVQKVLADVNEALIGFAIANRFLPCPDKTTAAGAGVAPNLPNDGLEDRTVAGGCVAANSEGNVPWATLGIPDGDPWGNRYRYRVTPAFANSATLFTVTSAGDNTVCTAAAAVCASQLATSVAAVVVDHGKNGRGAFNTQGVQNPLPPVADTDERSNAVFTTTPTGQRGYVSHTAVEVGGGGGEFDDQLNWLSPAILISRMVQAGRLP